MPAGTHVARRTAATTPPILNRPTYFLFNCLILVPIYSFAKFRGHTEGNGSARGRFIENGSRSATFPRGRRAIMQSDSVRLRNSARIWVREVGIRGLLSEGLKGTWHTCAQRSSTSSSRKEHFAAEQHEVNNCSRVRTSYFGSSSPLQPVSPSSVRAASLSSPSCILPSLSCFFSCAALPRGRV